MADEAAPTFVKVQDLRPGSAGINVHVKVGQPRASRSMT
jgi:hypothetical protein